MAGEMDVVRQRLLTGGAAGVQAWLEMVLGGAQRNAPVEEGTLRGAGYVDVQIDFGAGTVDGQVGFPLVYAARQHEELTWRHPRGGKAKYLEDEFKGNLPTYEQTVAAAAARFL